MKHGVSNRLYAPSLLIVMHQCLYIDEILNTIFNDPILSEDCPADSDLASSSCDGVCKRYSLLSLALTCKSFYEPATRVLWRHIDGIDRLIGSMSEDVVQRVPNVKKGASFDGTVMGSSGRMVGFCQPFRFP